MTNIDKMAHRTTALFLLEGVPDVKAEGSGFFGDGVPVGKHQRCGAANSMRWARTVFYMAEVNSNVAPFKKRFVIGRIREAMLLRNLGSN